MTEKNAHTITKKNTENPVNYTERTINRDRKSTIYDKKLKHTRKVRYIRANTDINTEMTRRERTIKEEAQDHTRESKKKILNTSTQTVY